MRHHYPLDHTRRLTVAHICLQWRHKAALLERQASHTDTARPLLEALAHSQLTDSGVKRFTELLERHARSHYMMAPPLDFSADHPVEEVGRSVHACALAYDQCFKIPLLSLWL